MTGGLLTLEREERGGVLKSFGPVREQRKEGCYFRGVCLSRTLA
jgi:hypothetical protein